jgi:hypothetical protein
MGARAPRPRPAWPAEGRLAMAPAAKLCPECFKFRPASGIHAVSAVRRVAINAARGSTEDW